MPMPDAIDGTGGGILGAIRARMQLDGNLVAWFSSGSSFNVKPYIQNPNTLYPYANLTYISGSNERDSGGYDQQDAVVQVSVFGEGYEPTRYVKDYVYTVLNGKLINMVPFASYLVGAMNPEPMRDPERSKNNRDIYHAPLRFKVARNTLYAKNSS
jgi:hypothetical protein